MNLCPLFPLPLLPPGVNDAAVIVPGDDDTAADVVSDLLDAGTDVPGDAPGSGTNRYVFLFIFFSSFFRSWHLAFSSKCSNCSSSFLHLPGDDDVCLPDDGDDDLPGIVPNDCGGLVSGFLILIFIPGVTSSEEDGGAAEPSG